MRDAAAAATTKASQRAQGARRGSRVVFPLPVSPTTTMAPEGLVASALAIASACCSTGRASRCARRLGAPARRLARASWPSSPRGASASALAAARPRLAPAAALADLERFLLRLPSGAVSPSRRRSPAALRAFLRSALACLRPLLLAPTASRRTTTLLSSRLGAPPGAEAPNSAACKSMTAGKASPVCFRALGPRLCGRNGAISARQTKARFGRGALIPCSRIKHTSCCHGAPPGQMTRRCLGAGADRAAGLYDRAAPMTRKPCGCGACRGLNHGRARAANAGHRRRFTGGW